MLIRFALCLSLFLGAFSILHAQGDLRYDPNQTASKTFQRAEQAMFEGDYERAIRHFQKVLKLSPELHAARRNMAKCLARLNKYKEAAEVYESLIDDSPEFSRVMYFEAADAQYKAGKHGRALILFTQFELLQNRDNDMFGLHGEKERQEEFEYLTKLPGNLRACEVSLDSVKFLNIEKVENLGAAINSRADEYFPCLSNDQGILFYTRRRNQGADENLYVSTYEKEHWTDSAPVSSKFNTPQHEGMSTLVRNGRTMFYTACNRKGVMGTCDIWVTSVDGLDVAEGESLKGYANSDRWESQAAISCDGSTLFFASNREGGFGGTDLWYSSQMPEGKWSAPVNLGPNINTESNEEAPFITNDGQTLYFSSTGHLGMGEGDIFMSRLGEDGEWGEPKNLGPPVNSAFHELGFFLSADGGTGYFASDRSEEGFGGMDIYHFKLTDQLFSKPITFVEGQVKDAVLKIPVKCLINIKGREPIETDEQGRFFFCIPAGEELDLTANKQFYYPYENQFPIPEWDNRSFYILDIQLRPVEREVNNEEEITAPDSSAIVTPRSVTSTTTHHHTVFFNFDSAELLADEYQKLQEFIQPLKVKEIEFVEVFGYADDVGANAYNLQLSEERAKIIALSILGNKILVDKIYLEGKGEIVDGNPKELNRRVEIKIVTKDIRN
jgi:outer membrane protein OmpA-like peptidoglycan-associated protein/tetratricopeptide (TPR) repeat protein